MNHRDLLSHKTVPCLIRTRHSQRSMFGFTAESTTSSTNRIRKGPGFTGCGEPIAIAVEERPLGWADLYPENTRVNSLLIQQSPLCNKRPLGFSPWPDQPLRHIGRSRDPFKRIGADYFREIPSTLLRSSRGRKVCLEFRTQWSQWLTSISGTSRALSLQSRSLPDPFGRLRDRIRGSDTG